jgi:hypothetical protein
MKYQAVVIGCGLMLVGCASLQNNVTMQGLPSDSRYVVDKTKPDSYPGFLAAEGNDMSCRYGIHYQSAKEFSPPKAQVFAGLLAQDLPAITSHKVVLEQFDVYENHLLNALHAVGSMFGGGLFVATLESAAHQNKDVFTTDKLIVDTKPGVDRHPKENQVGCSNRGEGEYYPSEISGGSDVVVIWLKFSVDDHPYAFRTYYQFQPAGREQVAAGIKDAIELSVNAIAAQVQI